MIQARAVLMLCVAVLASGCVTSPKSGWGTIPDKASKQIGPVTAQLTANCKNSGCKGFTLTINNVTSRDIEVNWNKTLYIEGGQTNGSFIYEGIVFADRNNVKSPDFVFANGTLTKEVFPNVFVSFNASKYSSGWTHADLPEGKNGLYLTVLDQGIEHSGALVFDLIHSPEFYDDDERANFYAY